MELGLVIGLSCAFGGTPQPSCPCRARTRNKHRLCWRSGSPAKSGDPVDVVVRAYAVTSTEVQGRVEAPSVSWKACPTFADVEDPDARPDTFLPARCRDADSGPGQLVTQPTTKEYPHA